MSVLELRPSDKCQYDLISLGEVMLRLDTGDSRNHTSRIFRAWEGGGEYNVARGLRRCFGKRTAIVTALADNAIGRLTEDLILQGGVDPSFIQWAAYDGIGRQVRNGLNFTERGFGIRGALGCSDRGNTAVAQLKNGDIDWEHIFGEIGVRWFHTGGIFAALSETTPEVALEAMRCAKKHGTIISYDLNYRPSLWQAIAGGHQPTSDTVGFDGKPVIFERPRDAAELGIATLHQFGGTFPLMSIGRSFFVGVEPYKGFGPFKVYDRKKAKRIAVTAVREFGITRIDDSDRLVGGLSGGERQSLAIARAVHFGDRVLILDEPTAALGVKEAAHVLRMVLQTRNKGIAVVFITHNVVHALTVGDYFAVLIRGSKAADFAQGEKSREEIADLMAGGDVGIISIFGKF
jgi:simple sugar transport system ATP-binding protein